MATLAENFEAFHAENPHIYTLLVRFSNEWRTLRGAEKISIAMVVERARWDLAVVTRSTDYKIANAHRAFYARLIMWQEENLRGLFNMAESEADAWIMAKISESDASKAS